MQKLSVIIVNFNTKDLLHKCLDNLKDIYSDLELIVVDNGSTDGSAQMVKQDFPQVILVENTNSGLAAGSNKGLEKATGDYLLYLGTDAFPTKDAIQGALEYMNKHLTIGVATCKLVTRDGKPDMDAHRGFPTPWAALTHFSGLNKVFPRTKLFNQYFLGYKNMTEPHEIDLCISHFMFIRKEVFASVSQDYDSLLFGTPRLIQNLTLARKRKTFSGWTEVKPEIIELEKVLNYLEVNLDQLICLGILVGTDYNPKGIPGIGQKKALEIVRKFKQPVLIFDSLKEKISQLSEEDKFDWKEIFELFHKPNVKNFDFKFGRINEKKIKEILFNRHNFSEERVDKQLERLKEITEKNKQKDLDKWF